MVFGWGRRRPEEAPARREVGIGEVRGIVSEAASLRESRAVSEVRRLRDRSAPLVDGLIEVGRLLEEDELDRGEVDRHIGVIVARGKKQVIDVIRRGVARLPEVSGPEDAQKLDHAMGQMLKKVGDVLGRQTRVIHLFAKRHAQQLKGGLEELDANRREIHRLVGEIESRREESGRILGLLDQVRAAESSASAARARLREAEEEAGSLGERIESLRGSVGEARASEGYRRYEETGEELARFESGGARIRAEAGAQFAKISRPLGRYEYGSSLDKGQKGVLGALVSDPYSALLPENEETVAAILGNVRRAISSGSISVKDVPRSLAQIGEVEAALGGLVRRISEYESGRARLRGELDSLRPAELEGLERDLAKSSSRREELLLKAESLRAEAAEAESRPPRLAAEIGRLLGGLTGAEHEVAYAPGEA